MVLKSLVPALEVSEHDCCHMTPFAPVRHCIHKTISVTLIQPPHPAVNIGYYLLSLLNGRGKPLSDSICCRSEDLLIIFSLVGEEGNWKAGKTRERTPKTEWPAQRGAKGRCGGQQTERSIWWEPSHDCLSYFQSYVREAVFVACQCWHRWMQFACAMMKWGRVEIHMWDRQGCIASLLSNQWFLLVFCHLLYTYIVHVRSSQ